MSWGDDLVTLMDDAGVGTLNVDLFKSTKSSVPIVIGSGAVVTIIETSGSGPERTQNSVIRPGYIRPSAMITARAHAYPVAQAKAQDAYDAVVFVRNSWVVSFVSSGWYREINPLQEPFDMGLDSRGQARCGFNVTAVKRP